jgi:prevent-host-death family protein
VDLYGNSSFHCVILMHRARFVQIAKNVQTLLFGCYLLILGGTMTGISATDARANFQELISRAEYRGERIVIERHGKAAVAIISLDDLKFLEAIEDAMDSEALRRAVGQNDGFTTLDAITQKRSNERAL